MEYSPDLIKGGINTELPASFYVYRIGNFTGFGITNQFKIRQKNHYKFFNKHKVKVKLIGVVSSSSGQEIFEIENKVKEHFSSNSYNSSIPGFKREALKGVNPSEVFFFAESLIKSKIDYIPENRTGKPYTKSKYSKLSKVYDELKPTVIDADGIEDILKDWEDGKDQIFSEDEIDGYANGSGVWIADIKEGFSVLLTSKRVDMPKEIKDRLLSMEDSEFYIELLKVIAGVRITAVRLGGDVFVDIHTIIESIRKLRLMKEIVEILTVLEDDRKAYRL